MVVPDVEEWFRVAGGCVHRVGPRHRIVGTPGRGAARAAACPPDCGTTSVVVADVWELIVTAGGGAH